MSWRRSLFGDAAMDIASELKWRGRVPAVILNTMQEIGNRANGRSVSRPICSSTAPSRSPRSGSGQVGLGTAQGTFVDSPAG